MTRISNENKNRNDWRRRRRWLLVNGPVFLLLAVLIAVPNSSSAWTQLVPLSAIAVLMCMVLVIYPVNWTLRLWARRRNAKEVRAGLGFYWRVQDWAPMEPSLSRGEWLRMQRRPKGARLVGAWRSPIGPVTLLECIDDKDEAWYLVGNVTARATPRWLVGLAVRCAANEPAGSQTRWAFRFFERIGCRWTEMSSSEVEAQLAKFGEAPSELPALGWRCRDGNGLLMEFIDADGQDYFVQQKTNEPEALWYGGFFLTYQKVWPPRISDSLAPLVGRAP